MIEFDPKWEYYVPSEEIDEEVIFDPFSSIDRKWGDGNFGFRFCSLKTINIPRIYLAPEKHSFREDWSIWRKCKHCQEWFEASRKERKYCSNECSAPYRGRPKELENIKCGNCQQEFEPYYTGQKYCSRKCAGIEFVKKEFESGCPICGSEVGQSKSNSSTPKKYCSRRCGMIARRRTYNRKLANAGSNERRISSPTSGFISSV